MNIDNKLDPVVKKSMGQYWLDTSNIKTDDDDQFLINLSFCRRIKISKSTCKILFRDIDEGWVSIKFKSYEDMKTYYDSLGAVMGAIKIEKDVLNSFM